MEASLHQLGLILAFVGFGADAAQPACHVRLVNFCEGYNQTHLRLNFSVVTGLTAFILARQLAEAVGIEPTLSGLEPDVLP